MAVSQMRDSRLILSSGLGWTVALAGLVAVFATYWDEAWHTDVGRDSAWALPHVLLYGSVALVGLGVAAWGVRVLVHSRSLRLTLAQAPLLAAGLGALGALGAAPIDAAWHAAYGRDAVLFSPPHMLVVLASTALVLGVLAGLPAQGCALRATAGVLLLANAAAVVFEYEADVPQFSEVLYLPVLLVVEVAAVWVVRGVVPVRWPATTVVLGYAGLRLTISLGLLALGRSTPDLPLAVLGLAVLDLPLRRPAMRITAAVVTTAALAWAASAVSLASPAASDVAVVAAPAIGLGLLLLAIGARSRGGLLVAALLPAVALLVLGPPEPAQAHDPGQGQPVTSVRLVATTDARGEVVLTTGAGAHCDDLEPRAVTARRAGTTTTAPLTRAGDCGFRGRVRLTEPGRWFVYAEFDHAGTDRVEAWLPVEVGTPATAGASRELYRPAGGERGVTATQVVLGGLVYAVGLGLLAVGVRAAAGRRRS